MSAPPKPAQKPAAPSKPFAWSDPDEAFKKKKLSIEIIGLQGLGKTHFALTFPKPALCDSEHKAYLVMRKFANKKWFPATSLDDARRFVEACIADKDIETVIFDSGSDMQDWAEQEYMKEKGAASVYPTVEYKKVYKKIDAITHSVVDAAMNFVTTARTKDEYLQDTKTGRLIRDSYKN